MNLGTRYPEVRDKELVFFIFQNSCRWYFLSHKKSLFLNEALKAYDFISKDLFKMHVDFLSEKSFWFTCDNFRLPKENHASLGVELNF